MWPPLSVLAGLVVLLPQRAWHASAVECSSANYDCAACVATTESGCLFFDCQCSFCASSGMCTNDLTARCAPDDTWVESAASCPADLVTPACTGKVCEEERFKDAQVLAGAGLSAKACCEHGTIAHNSGDAQATCSFPQDCSITCSRNMQASGEGPDATCVCKDEWYGLDQQCSTHCSAEDECSGHGVCGPDGKCQCDEGWKSATRQSSNAKQCTLQCGPHAHANYDKCVCDNHFWPEWEQSDATPGSACTAYCDPAITCSGHGRCDPQGFCVCTEKDENGRNYTQSGIWNADKQEWINCSKAAGVSASAPQPSAVSGDDENKFGRFAKSAFSVLLGIIMAFCLCMCFCMSCSQRRDKRRAAADFDQRLSSYAAHTDDGATGRQQQVPAGAGSDVDLASSFMARAQFGAYGQEEPRQFPRCDTLAQLLELLGLNAYAEALAGLGVQEIEQLADLSLDDLQACGIDMSAQCLLQSYWSCYPPMAGLKQSTLGGVE